MCVVQTPEMVVIQPVSAKYSSNCVVMTTVCGVSEHQHVVKAVSNIVALSFLRRVF